MVEVVYDIVRMKSFHGDAAQYGTNGLIMGGKCMSGITLPNTSMTTDTLTVDVNADALIGEAVEDFRTLAPGTPMWLMQNGWIYGTWYLQTINRVNRRTLRLTMTSGAGLLASAADHNGGIYTGEDAGDIIDEIFSACPTIAYDMSGDVRGTQLYGRLPRDSRKNNLARILQAIGANLVQTGSGYDIAFLGADYYMDELTGGYVYADVGDTDQRKRATAIEVTEHSFYALNSDEVVTLFDNTGETSAASNQLVVFSEPCHDLAAAGLTIVSSGPNYAVVSGTGTLTGKEYTHTKRVKSRSTSVPGPEYVVRVENNELVGMHNSDYLATRLYRYCTISKAPKIEAYDREGKLTPGQRMRFCDTYGDSMVGWIEAKEFELANKTRATLKIVTGWSPGPFGNNIDQYVLFDEAGSYTWTVPAGINKIRMVLGQGGSGGSGGMPGTAGSDGSLDDDEPTPGTGGTAGTAGSAGKIFAPVIEYQVTPGSTITITVGAGGAAGAANGGSGGAGTHSTVTRPGQGTVSSNAGSIQPDGYHNLFTGDVYGQEARDGFDGADGGTWLEGEEAADVDAGDAVYTGGLAGASIRQEVMNGRATVYAKGGGGSGAVYGHDGANGGDGVYYNANDFAGGDGGNAPTPDELPDVATCSSGGAGGNGGGGGGAGGNAYRSDGGGSMAEAGEGGLGSSGSAGKKGGDGFVLIMYKESA